MTFYFQVKVDIENKAFSNQQLRDNLIGAAQMVITSKEYSDYDTCIKDLQTFMKAKVILGSTKKEKYAIKWEKNPFVLNEIDEDDENAEKESERWFSNEVLKMFVMLERHVKSGEDTDDAPISASMFSDVTRIAERKIEAKTLH